MSALVACLALVTQQSADVLNLNLVSDPTARACLQSVEAPLRASKGTMSPEVRAGYVQWAWTLVLNSLRAKGLAPSSDVVAEIESDADLKLAMAATVFPPDPSIVQNYVSLRSHLGPERSKKYRNLIVGIAVARRTQSVLGGPNEGVGRENQGPIWAYQPIFRPHDESERQFINQLASYMRASGKSALDCFQDPTVQTQLKSRLTAAGVAPRFVNEVGRTSGFGERLKNAMIVLGQRPNSRSPKPAFFNWIDHLIRVYESTPKALPNWEGQTITWPLFPLESAPWPLLMPLSYTVPMDEATYLWDSFQGIGTAPTFHVYGPYRDDLTKMPDELRPSKWFWNAVPDQNIHGGQCMPLSLATLDLYSSLGRPAMDAAQPDHANLISFGFDGGVWKSDVEQDFAGGPRVTYAQWYFSDPVRHELNYRDLFGWPTSEYPLGLAAGMNLGVTSYLDTRIAARIYDLLPAPSRRALGTTLLKSSLIANPFNPEVWYRLSNDTSDSRFAINLLEAARTRDLKHLEPGVGQTPWDLFVQSGKTDRARGCIDAYWSVLAENVARKAVLGHPAPQDEALLAVGVNALSNTPYISGEEMLRYTERWVDPTSESLQKANLAYDQKLAASGDRFGLLRMGMRLLDGDGVPADWNQAHAKLLSAAQKGDPIAGVLLRNLEVYVPAEGMVVAANSVYSPLQDPSHLVDGSGMNGIFHDNSAPAGTMWHTADNPSPSAPADGLPASPAWIKITFPRSRPFQAIEIWNHNQANLVNRGLRHITIYGSPDGQKWQVLEPDVELPCAVGAEWQTPTRLTSPNFNRPYRAIILAASAKDGNYGGVTYGLSEVHFVDRLATRSVPSAQIQVRASSQYSALQDPGRLIDGSGISGETHDNEASAATMWHTVNFPTPSSPSPGLPQSPAWVRFNFAVPHALESVQIWNFNQATLPQRGFRRTRIYGSTDGDKWFPLTSPDVVQLPRAPGSGPANSITYFTTSGDKKIRAVVIMADEVDGSYGDTQNGVYGLSEVRFLLPGQN